MVQRLALLLIVGSVGWLAVGPSARGQAKEEEAARKRAAAAAAIEKLGGRAALNGG